MRELFGPDHYDAPYYQSIEKFLRGLEPKPVKGLEVGFCWGMSAKAFLTETEGTLLSLDLDDQMGKALEFEQYGDRFELRFGDSSSLMKRLKGKYDWIYIDGDHEYAAVKKDLEAALPLLAKNGVMWCDDYGNPCGVKQAVDEFVKAHNLTVSHADRSPSGAVVLCLS